MNRPPQPGASRLTTSDGGSEMSPGRQLELPATLSRRHQGNGLLRTALGIFQEGGKSQSTAARLQITILTTVVILIATLGSGIILARALGPAGRGVLTAAMLYGPLLVSVGSLGIAEALVYRSSREDTA